MEHEAKINDKIVAYTAFLLASSPFVLGCASIRAVYTRLDTLWLEELSGQA